MTIVARLLAGVLVGMLLVTPAMGTSCADVLEWRGVLYEGLYEERDVRSREPAFAGQLAEPAVDACIDEESVAASTGCQAREGEARTRSEGEAVDVFGLRGVDPEVAFGARRPGLSRVYIAPGYFVRLRSHPLHEALFGRGAEARPVDEVRRWSCGRPLEEAGTVRLSSPWFLSVRFDGDRIRRESTGEIGVAVDVRTTVSGQMRNGLPYVEEGDRIVAHVRECTSRGRYGVVADEIRVESG
ncbi:MAG: hypothetical protein KY396_09245 [Actinobacteria bacterium]|nr:hypothetical protein [Actinomycetota bacterium]